MRGIGLWLVPVSLAIAAPAGATAPSRSNSVLTDQIDAAKAAMMGDPARALALGDTALRTAEALPPSRDATVSVATARWLKGEALLFLNRPDRAGPLIEAALAAVNRAAPGTRLQGDLLRSRGALAASGNRAQEALAAYQAAYRVFTVARQPRQQALALGDIGQLYETAGDYRRALTYYEQATQAYAGDPVMLLLDHNNRAEVLRKLHRDVEAEAQFKTALRQARQLRNTLLQVKILCLLAMVQTDRGELAPAQASVDRAARLSDSGEAPGLRPFVLGAGARVAAGRKEFDRAATLLRQMFAGVDLTTTDPNYREFHKIASDVFARTGQPALALAHMIAFDRLEGGARDATASVGAQLMSARFDFANQNLRIATLQRGELERDYKLIKQRSLLLTVALGAGAVLLALLLFGTMSLRLSRNRLRKALAAKTEFLATTSHEIRTPLNGILGMAQVLLARDDLDRDVREKVQLLFGAGKTMRALVDDILDVAKMEKGEVSVLTGPTPLRQLLLDTGALWRGHAQAKGLELRIDIDVPKTVLSDESRLRQIVSNLLSNAVKFTEQGTVSLSARVEAGASGAEMLHISVADSGIGIASAQRKLVFDAFHQVDGATTRQFSGTGLGLAICRRLAQAFGGTLTVESEEGAGSVFSLRLPLLRAAAVEGEAATVIERPATLGRATALVVTTNLVTQGVLLSLLEQHAETVEVVRGFDQARAALAEGRIHHLLIDASAQLQQLEGADGIRELIARANEVGVLSTLLVAADGAVPVADLLLVGATQAILKPVAGAALVNSLRELHAAPSDDSQRLDRAA